MSLNAEPERYNPPTQNQMYQVTWMDRDGAYEVRSYAPEGVVIGTQDGVLMVAARAQDPTPLLVIPTQRLVSVELV